MIRKAVAADLPGVEAIYDAILTREESLIVLTLNLVGDGLRDALDPKLKQ